MNSENNIKWIKFLAGFFGWFLVSTLVFVLIQGNYYITIIYWLIYMAINVLVMIIFSIWKPMRWISLGIVSAMGLNFLITLGIGSVYGAVCFVPVTNLALETRHQARITPLGTALPQNNRPMGYHDGSSGRVDQANCVAFGWTYDPDDRRKKLRVRVLSDGEVLVEKFASEYRSDLNTPDGCPEGKCGFLFDLWKLVAHNEEHHIQVQAHDLQSQKWSDLSSTPKTLNCGD